jgi:hypothetical protein
MKKACHKVTCPSVGEVQLSRGMLNHTVANSDVHWVKRQIGILAVKLLYLLILTSVGY